MTDLGDFDLASDESDQPEVPESGTAIGTVTVREGLTLSEEPGGDRIEAYITPEHRDDVRLRGYVVVPLDGAEGSHVEHLFCRIERLRYAHEFSTDDATAIHSRRALSRDGIDESDYKFIASLHPLATVVGDPTDDKVTMGRRLPDTLPKPDATVRQAAFESEIKTGLKLPSVGLFVGHLAVSGERVMTAATPPTVDYRLDDEGDDPMLFRHVLVAGGTGSGKTHATKNILRQIVADGRTYDMPDGRSVPPAVVIVDPQDEYAQLHDDNPALSDEFRRQLRREDIAFGGVDDTKVLVPVAEGTKYSPRDHRAEQVPITIPFELVRSNHWLIAGSRLNDKQLNALSELLRRYFHQADQPTYRDFVDFLDDDTVIASFTGDGKIHEQTYDAVRRRVNNQTFRRTFDQDGRPITEATEVLVRAGGISTIPTYHLNSGAQRTLVVLAIASLLIDEKLTSDPYYPRIADRPLVLAMDEAHNYLAAANSVQAARVIRKFTDAAKQGRKERLGLFLVTQDPGDIAEDIRKQLNTRISLNLSDEDAIASLNLERSLAKQVPELETGQMVVHSPDNAKAVQLLGLNQCVVKHGTR